MVDSLEVKEMAARSKIMKDVLLAEVRLFYASWGDRLFLMTKRHKEEQKKLMAKGKMCSYTNKQKCYGKR